MCHPRLLRDRFLRWGIHKFGFSEIHIRTNRLKYILLVDKVHIKMFKVSIALKIVAQVLFQITFVVNHDEKVSRNKKVSAQILFGVFFLIITDKKVSQRDFFFS
mgnify:CR=1 FL=1